MAYSSRNLSGRYCSAINCCKTSRRNPGTSFHRFPVKNKDRTKIWINNSRRKNYNLEKLHHYFFCDDHFESSEFMCPSDKSSTKKHKRLMPKAVPTLFSVPKPPSTVHLKRNLPIVPATKRRKISILLKMEDQDDLDRKLNVKNIKFSRETDLKISYLEDIRGEIDLSCVKKEFSELTSTQHNGVSDEMDNVNKYLEEETKGENYLSCVKKEFSELTSTQNNGVSDEMDNVNKYLEEETKGEIDLSCVKNESNETIYAQDSKEAHSGSCSVTQTGGNLFHYGVCATSFDEYNKLIDHRLMHTGHVVKPSGVKPFECGSCSKQFFEKGSLNRHLLTHSGVKAFECGVCSKKFARKGDLTQHLLTHSGMKPFECDFCSKKFAGKQNFNFHLTEHSEEKPFHCDLCSKKFACKTNLSHHLRTHNKVKPFECHICPKKFSQSGILKRHVLVHSGQKPFECDICSKKFSQNGTLKRHLLIHSGQKPFECDICSKRFSQNISLKKHLFIHIGETGALFSRHPALPLGCE